MIRKLSVSLLVAALAVAPAFAARAAKGKAAKANRTAAAQSNSASENLPPRGVFLGLSEAEEQVVLDMVLKTSRFKDDLKGSRYRVFAVNAGPVKTRDGVRREAHTIIYDYTHDKGYHVVNDVTAGAPGTIIDSYIETSPIPPSMEEYTEARALVMEQPQVKKLMEKPNVALQDGFSVGAEVPGCGEHRCIFVPIIESDPPANPFGKFLLIATVDLSARRVVELRVPKGPNTLAR